MSDGRQPRAVNSLRNRPLASIYGNAPEGFTPPGRLYVVPTGIVSGGTSEGMCRHGQRPVTRR